MPTNVKEPLAAVYMFVCAVFVARCGHNSSLCLHGGNCSSTGPNSYVKIFCYEIGSESLTVHFVFR